jgi:hypothetical protein
MPIGDFARPWSDTALRHRPSSSSRSILDDEYLGQQHDNRGSGVGVRAWSFASDIGLVVGEYGRHVEVDLPDGQSERLARSVYKVPIAMDRVLYLTDPATVAAMGAQPINSWLWNLRATQSAARYLLEQVPDLQGLVVPSVAFLDRPDRPNIVVYRDRVDPAAVFGTPAFVRDIVLAGRGFGAV